MLQRASRSGLPVMQGGAGMFTASKPADRKVVPDDPGDRTMFKVVYVVLESQYQSSLTAACKRINAGQPDVAVECSGYILEELRDPENFEQFKADVKDANIFIGSLIFVQELADKVEEVVAPERERLDAVCIFPSMPQVMRLNKIGSFSMATMGQSKNVMMDFMKKNKPGGTSFQDGMLKLVRTLPKALASAASRTHTAQICYGTPAGLATAQHPPTRFSTLHRCSSSCRATRRRMRAPS